MTVTEFIDEIVGYSDNVQSAGADYADRRQRVLYWLQREAAQVYYHREWPWRLKWSEDVTVPATQGWGQLPADYLSLGKFGHVYNMSQDGVEMEPASESELTDLLAMDTQIVNSRIYAIFGTDGSVDPPRRKIWIPVNPNEVTLRIGYHPTMPTLDETPTNVNNLNDACPIEYQETVLIPGVAARAKRSKSDARWKDDLAERMDGLKNMIKNSRRFQGGEQRLPSFFGY
jgi:hypothetical protein